MQLTFMKLLIEFIISFVSTVGFGIITNVPRRSLLPGGITGAVAWTAYVILNNISGTLFMPNMVAAVIIGILGNLFAILYKVPVNMIYVPSLVSLVPGGIIYEAMRSFAQQHVNSTLEYLMSTLIVAMALTAGFFVSEWLFRAIRIRMRQLEIKERANK